MHSRQNLWPHAVTVGTAIVSQQMGQCKAASAVTATERVGMLLLLRESVWSSTTAWNPWSDFDELFNNI